jgi:hypothetical protein
MFKTMVKTDVTDVKTIQFCIDAINKIDNQYSDIKTNNIDAFDYYFGVNYMKDIPGRSQVYTSDLADTIEWIMPSLVKIFAGGDDVTSLTPRKKENAEQVAAHNELINYQIKVKNKWFIIINDWFKDALLLKRGAVKYQWHKEVEEEEKSYENLSEMELQQLASDPDVVRVSIDKENVLKNERLIGSIDERGMIVPQVQPAVKSYNVTLTYQLVDEYPLIEAVPAEEYGFPIDTRDLDSCTMFYHRTKYKKWQFINKFGQEKFKNIEELKNTFHPTANDQSVDEERFVDVGGLTGGFFYDQMDDTWLVYECFYTNADNGKKWLSVICGNVLLKDEENKYKRPPFEVLTSIKLSHRIIGMSMFDLLKDLQRIRTSLLRQMLDEGYFNLNGRWLIDPTKVSFEDFLNANRPGGIIRTLNGQPADENGIRQLQGNGLSQFSFALFEQIEKEKDYHTGVPRSFQGVTPDTLQKTMRGQNQQVMLAQQRIEMMARLFAEMGIAPLIRDIIDMNMRFLNKSQALKVVNDWIEVGPEDVVAKADVIINVGLGTTSKDILVQQNQQMIALYMQMYQIFGPILNDKILHALKELVKAMGYRDTQNWVPGEEETDNPQMQQLMAFMLAAKHGLPTQAGQSMNAQAEQATQPRQPNLTTPDINGEYFG